MFRVGVKIRIGRETGNTDFFFGLIIITFDYISLKIINKQFIRINTLCFFLFFCKNYLNSEKSV